MSTLTDWSYLPLLLDGPLYIVSDPINVPVAIPVQPVAAPVEEPPVAAPPKVTTPSVPQLSGPVPIPRRRSKVMVLYNEQTTPHLQPVHETLLVNILKSVGLTLADVELVNLNHIKRVDYAEIMKEKTLHQLISFGIDLRELRIHIPLTAYSVQKVEEINMLLADSFHELQLNTDKKRLLWTCLKQMFLK